MSNIVNAVLVWFLSAVCVCAAVDEDSVVYRVSFDTASKGSLRSQWSGPITLTADPSSGQLLLGRFGNDAVTLTLRHLPAHASVEIDVTVCVIGSWDGVVDNDRLRIVVDGTDTLLHASFSNTVYRQSYPDDVGKGVHRQRSEARRQNTLGFRFVEPGIYAGPLDATYHIMVANDHRADSITITFEGILKDLRKGIDNESWALRGVEVKTRRPPALYHRAIMVPSAPSFEEDAFPGIVTTAPVLHELRVPVVVIECPSCGPSCESFSLSVFADRTVARWAGYPRRGEPTAVITLQPSEYDTVEALVQQCLHDSLAYRYVVSTMQGSSATPQRQCEVLLGIAGEARTVVVRDDPPASMQALTSTLRMLFTRYGWNNVP